MKAHKIADLEHQNIRFRLTTKGQFPLWLSGVLIRNGPINVTINKKINSHWFDGLAMLHAFKFDKGQVNYTNKFLKTNAYSQVFENKSLDYDGFAIDPCRSLFKRLYTCFFPQSHSYLHNANVNIAKIANHYVALTETPLPVEFDADTLETLGVLDYQDNLPKKGSWESAHPHYINEENKIINYCIQYGINSFYLVYYLDKDKSCRKIICKIPVENPAYMHSFAITKNYIILTEFPFKVKPLKLLVNFRIKGESFISNFSWEPELGTTFIIINRHTGKLVKKYTTKAFFSFHHANAYEQDNEIFMDVVSYDNADIIKGLADHTKTHSTVNENYYSTKLERFKISLKTNKINSYLISNKYLEFPRLNEKLDGKFYKYLYLIDPRRFMSEKDERPIYKIDMETSKIKQWSEKGCYPGEPVFIPYPNTIEEDKGVILSIVLNQTLNYSFLLALDAKSLKEIARADIKHAIPAGLHGQYYEN